MPQNGIHPRPFIIIKPFHKMDAYGILLLLINCATKWDASEKWYLQEPCSDSPKAHQWRTKGAPVRTKGAPVRTNSHQRAWTAHQWPRTCAPERRNTSAPERRSSTLPWRSSALQWCSSATSMSLMRAPMPLGGHPNGA